MDIKRKPFQGILNIIQFNWHYYVLSVVLLVAAFIFYKFLPVVLHKTVLIVVILASLSTIASLLASFWIYDCSGLYKLWWIDGTHYQRIVNIHAGFDETTQILQDKFPASQITTCDFYDPKKHTEISIKRARRRYPPNNSTQQINTQQLPFDNDLFDISVVIFSAHEIRNKHERKQFFVELARVTKPSGSIIVTEHLRDLNNFLAYTIGFFHFYSGESWGRIFYTAGLRIEKEISVNPFVKTYILKKNGFAY